MSQQTVQPVTINGISCTFSMPGGRLSMSESAGEEGPRTTLVYQVPWPDRWNLVKALRGTCTQTGGRTPPFALPSNNNMVCTAVGDFGYIGSGANPDGSIYAPLATLPAQFSCVPWQFVDGSPTGQGDASGQAWTVTKIRPSAEVYQPTGGTYWVGPFSPSTTPVDENAVAFLRANCEISVCRKFLPAMTLAGIKAALGSVNLNITTFADTTFPVGCLVLMGAEASEPYFDCMGNPVMDINYVYLGRSQSWNKVQDRTATWQLVNSLPNGTGTAPCPLYDFSTLPR